MTQTFLITGASSGLGRALAERMLEAGDRVAVTARRLADAEAVAAPFGARALPLALDVTDEASVAAAVGAAQEWSGGLDVLVNNAAYGLYGAVEEVADGEMRAVFETNVFGVVRMVQRVLPAMRAAGRGTIVNVGSIAGLVGGPGNGFYAATKFAIEGLSEALAAELGPFGIRVILLEPSGIRTDFHARSYRRAARRIEDYEATAGRQIETYLSRSGRQAGDPRRIADVLHDLLASDAPPLRVLLGNSAVERAREKLAAQAEGIDAFEALSRSIDYPA